MRLDLHVHTRYSPDGRASPRDLVALARARGLDGIAITDHNAIRGALEGMDAATDGFLVVPATEVSTSEGHVLGYGVREVLPRDLPAAETVERIVAAGGVAVAAHPYRFWSGLGPEVVERTPFPAYETRNARTAGRGNERARAAALARRVGETGGSDSHGPDEVGLAVTIIDAGPLSVDGVVQAIGQGRTRAEGQDRAPAATVRYVTKCVGEWLARGMRRI